MSDLETLVKDATPSGDGPVSLRHRKAYAEDPDGNEPWRAELVCGSIGRSPERPLAAVVARYNRKSRSWSPLPYRVVEYAIGNPIGRNMSVRDVWLLQQCGLL
jgi:hypothetical protein